MNSLENLINLKVTDDIKTLVKRIVLYIGAIHSLCSIIDEGLMVRAIVDALLVPEDSNGYG